ncbi:MAG: DUF368 domain-containing protein [Defluviitaleaceae bacterium]|nr:DUF368 domain-containing protein [Defluviitaleaceae bacterium]
MLSYIKSFANGAVFGVAQIVPGVSSSTLAIVIGFYNKLLTSVSQFTKDPKQHLKFLIPFALGLGVGILAFAHVISFLIENFSLPSITLFVGLIAGIVPSIFANTKITRGEVKPLRVVFVILPVIGLIAMSHLAPSQSPDPVAYINNIGFIQIIHIFAAGFLSAAAMVVPGISGAFVLLLMGLYHVLTHTLSAFASGLTDFDVWRGTFTVILPFGIGILLGVIIAAKIVEKLLSRYSASVYSVILGLMLGSVYALFNDDITYQSGISAGKVAAAAGTFVVGLALSYIFGKREIKSHTKDNKRDEENL